MHKEDGKESRSIQLLVHKDSYFKEFQKGSVLGPMLLNIYISDMFFALNEIDISNFADDTTP